MKHVNLLLVLVAFCCLMTSCKDEDSTEIRYQLTCSKDLLEFVTPVMTFPTQSGRADLRITEDMWDDNGQGSENVSFAGVVDFDHVGGDYTFSVRYELNENALENIDAGREYKLDHKLSIPKVNVIKDGSTYVNSSSIDIDISGSININGTVIVINGDENTSLSEYLNKLVVTLDTKRVVVDGSGHIDIY